MEILRAGPPALQLHPHRPNDRTLPCQLIKLLRGRRKFLVGGDHRQIAHDQHREPFSPARHEDIKRQRHRQQHAGRRTGKPLPHGRREEHHHSRKRRADPPPRVGRPPAQNDEQPLHRERQRDRDRGPVERRITTRRKISHRVAPFFGETGERERKVTQPRIVRRSKFPPHIAHPSEQRQRHRDRRQRRPPPRPRRAPVEIRHPCHREQTRFFAQCCQSQRRPSPCPLAVFHPAHRQRHEQQAGPIHQRMSHTHTHPVRKHHRRPP